MSANPNQPNNNQPNNNRPFGLVIMLMVAALLVGLLAPAASASYSRGVKSMDFTINTGGPYNKVHISQHYVDGAWSFDTIDLPTVLVNVSVSADCRAGKSLQGGVFQAGYQLSGDIAALQESAYTQSFETPDANSVESQEMTFHVPIAAVFEPYGEPFDEAVLFARGEQAVADAMASGLTEDEARADSYMLQEVVNFHALIKCVDNSGGWIYKWVEGSTAVIELIYYPAEINPGVVDEIPTPQGLQVANQVTQAQLSVIPDPADSCIVHASVTFVTNGAMTVEYQIVDDFGQHSQLMSLDIDDSGVGFFSHEVTLPAAADFTDDDMFAPQPHGGLDGPADDFAQADDGSVTGVLHVEGVSPHEFMSNYDGFSVDPCVPEAEVLFDPFDDFEVDPGSSR